MEDGFRMAMMVCAGLSVLGGILAWLTIEPNVLEAEPEATARLSTDRSCAITGTPLQPGRGSSEAPVAASPASS